MDILTVVSLRKWVSTRIGIGSLLAALSHIESHRGPVKERACIPGDCGVLIQHWGRLVEARLLVIILEAVGLVVVFAAVLPAVHSAIWVETAIEIPVMSCQGEL